MTKRRTSRRIPFQLLKELREKGATVETITDENLHGVFGMFYQDDAWKVLENWGITVDIEPWVSIGFYPSANIANSSLSPPQELGCLIQNEATSIVHYYSTLRMEDFEENAAPNIGAPLQAPPANPRIHHATMALSKLMERIQNPPSNYPTLLGLRSGSYICTVTQHWANMLVEIVLMKP